MQELRNREAERGAGTRLNIDEYDRKREESINSVVGHLAGAHCEECKDKGFIATVQNGCVTSRECSCMASRHSVERLSKSGLSGLLKDCTFPSFKTSEQWQKDAKQKAMEYAENPANAWFLACGAVGSGKTHLCTAICGALLNKGKFVWYMRWRDDSVRLKAVVNDSEYEELINPYKRCQVLYIDDLFKGGVTEADKRLAFQIFDYRYCNRHLSTIISTENTPEQLLAMDEATGSRIWERSEGNCVVITGQHNYRMR